jgi:hypothetical protein
MSGTTIRRGFAYGFVAIYVLYALANIGMTGLLFSFAVGLIVSSFEHPVELVSAAIILSGLLWKVFFSRKKETFVGEPVGRGQSAIEISKKIEQISNKRAFETSGVLSSRFVEGFADAQDKPKEDKPTDTSAPAPVDAPTATEAFAKDLPSANAAASSTPPAQQTPPNPNGANAAPTVSGFNDKGTSGMFKLGSIPSDAAGGAHIDVGTTLMNALNSLKPDQVKQMTDDTRKLMETQKSLMDMLGTMKPLLSDGKQMMDTFQGMFGANTLPK